METDNQTITDIILSTEDYVPVSPETKLTFEFNLAMLIKNAIREHKYFCGTRNEHVDWETAKSQWMKLYQKDFLNYVKSHFAPPTRRKKSIADKINYTFERRNPMISGGIV